MSFVMAELKGPLTDIYVVSDAHGFVGAFTTLEKANALARTYAPVPFLIHRYGAEPDGSPEHAWMVIYRANEAVAYATNKRETAEKVQKTYLALGLVYDEDVGYWQHPLNLIAKSASLRLDAVRRLTEISTAISIADDIICVPSRDTIV